MKRQSSLLPHGAAATLAFAFFATAITAAAKPPSSLSADIDADGKPETISWKKFVTTEDHGDFYQVFVHDDDGTLLWESPKKADPENKMVFGDWHYGYSLPEIAADIDGDGLVEVVAPAPQSDVSPTYYRVFCWQRGRLEHVRLATLMRSKRDPDHFPWSESEEYEGAWISQFRRSFADGTLLVDVFEYIGDKTPRQGKAIITPTAEGVQVTKWIEPLAPLEDMPAPEPFDPPAAGGETGGVVYRARLSAADHQNSAGTILVKVPEILRQDRANYHKGKGDAQDGADSLFTTYDARATMGTRAVVPVGISADALHAAVIGGTPLVEVEVTPTALKVKVIE